MSEKLAVPVSVQEASVLLEQWNMKEQDAGLLGSTASGDSNNAKATPEEPDDSSAPPMCRCGHLEDDHGSAYEQRAGEKHYIQRCLHCACECVTRRGSPLDQLMEQFRAERAASSESRQALEREMLAKQLEVRRQLLGDTPDPHHPPTPELARQLRQQAEALERERDELLLDRHQPDRLSPCGHYRVFAMPCVMEDGSEHPSCMQCDRDAAQAKAASEAARRQELEQALRETAHQDGDELCWCAFWSQGRTDHAPHCEKARAALLGKCPTCGGCGSYWNRACPQCQDAALASGTKESTEDDASREAAKRMSVRGPSSTSLVNYEALYNELLYQVARKHPNETRHETALRYIRQAETGDDTPKCAAGTKRPGCVVCGIDAGGSPYCPRHGG
jgi:hypothetical protein